MWRVRHPYGLGAVVPIEVIAGWRVGPSQVSAPRPDALVCMSVSSRTKIEHRTRSSNAFVYLTVK